MNGLPPYGLSEFLSPTTTDTGLTSRTYSSQKRHKRRKHERKKRRTSRAS